MDKSKITAEQIDKSTRNIGRIKIVAVISTIVGVGVFSYFVYSVGLDSVLSGVASLGVGGFAVILFVYFLKLLTRAAAWRLTVYEPHTIRLRDTFPAVVIGEALTSVIPLGILVSGTAKALAVRKHVPLVVGLASVATENLFYSLITGLFICLGAVTFIGRYPLPTPFDLMIDAVVVLIVVALLIGTIMVIRQWHWASGICNRLYSYGFFPRTLKNGRLHVRMFENLIYGFYRAHPKRFFPLCGFQILFHSLGIFEVWFIVTRISGAFSGLATPFFLESMSRLVTVVFKLVPFLIGVDEASAEFVVETLGVAAGIGVTLAIVRKGRVIFWAIIGFILIAKRGLTLTEVKAIHQAGYPLDQTKHESA